MRFSFQNVNCLFTIRELLLQFDSLLNLLLSFIHYQFKIQRREMINGNDYEALTTHGIDQLFDEHFEGQQFILQIRQIIPSPQAFTVLISDGYTWIKGQFTNKAKAFVSRYSNTELNNSVITFLSEDIQMFPSNYEFKLNRILVIDTRVHCMIGEPLPYSEYIKNGYFNATGSNKIPKLFLPIKKIKEMEIGKVTGTIRAKVLRKPDKVNTFMNIVIEDDAKDQIQCCFFGDKAHEYKNFLMVGGWYCFENPILQMNNRLNIIELKITANSKITKEKQQSIKPGIINNNIQQSAAKVKRQIVQFDVGKGLRQGFDPTKNYFIVARVLKNNKIRAEVGRSFDCIDQNSDLFQIMLWTDCQEEVTIGQTYKFSDLKAKIYREKITLQSQWKFTKITIQPVKIRSKNQKLYNIPYNEENMSGRPLGSNPIVYSISQMVELSRSPSQHKLYIISTGYLIVNFEYVGVNMDFINEIKRKLFFMRCEKCEDNEYVKTKTTAQLIRGQVVCGHCKQSDNLTVMWNIKINFFDARLQIPCKLNSEVAVKLLNKTPLEGLNIFFQSSEKLKRLIEKKLNYCRGVFKFNIKKNDRKPDEPFFNICESFANDDRFYLDRAKKELKKTEQIYRKYENWPNQQEGKTRTQGSSLKKKSFSRQNSEQQQNREENE